MKALAWLFATALLAGCSGGSTTQIPGAPAGIALSEAVRSIVLVRTNPTHAAYAAALQGCDADDVELAVEPGMPVTTDPATFTVFGTGDGTGSCTLLLSRDQTTEVVPVSYAFASVAAAALELSQIQSELGTELTQSAQRRPLAAPRFPRAFVYGKDGTGPLTFDRVGFFQNYARDYYYVVLDDAANRTASAFPRIEIVLKDSASTCYVLPATSTLRALYYYTQSHRADFFGTLQPGVHLSIVRVTMYFNNYLYPFDTSTCRVAFGEPAWAWLMVLGP